MYLLVPTSTNLPWLSLEALTTPCLGHQCGPNPTKAGNIDIHGVLRVLIADTIWYTGRALLELHLRGWWFSKMKSQVSLYQSRPFVGGRKVGVQVQLPTAFYILYPQRISLWKKATMGLSTVTFVWRYQIETIKGLSQSLEGVRIGFSKDITICYDGLLWNLPAHNTK